MGKPNILTILIMLAGLGAQGQTFSTCGMRVKNNLEKIDIQMSPDASALADRLKAQGFSCDKPSPGFERGYRCRGKVPGYPQAVNIFVPPHFKKQNALPYALHLHGHNLVNPKDPEFHFNVKNGDGDYGKMLAQSGANSLLVIPESLGKNATYREYFQKPVDLDRVLQGVEEATGAKIEALSISSHSGGDQTMDRLGSWYLSGDRGSYLGKTKNIALFDSLYAERKNISGWVQALAKDNNQFKFLGSYVVGPGASTVARMQWFKSLHPSSKNFEYREIRTQHMSIMKDGGFSDFLKLSCDQ